MASTHLLKPAAVWMCIVLTTVYSVAPLRCSVAKIVIVEGMPGLAPVRVRARLAI